MSGRSEECEPAGGTDLSDSKGRHRGRQGWAEAGGPKGAGRPNPLCAKCHWFYVSFMQNDKMIPSEKTDKQRPAE